MKALFLVIDGLADISHPELAWSTPLQAAETPTLDRLAREGCCASMYPLRPGVCPSSEVAHWSMFGYGLEEFPGRAFLHALAAGLPFEAGDALFMFNLVAVERRPEGVFVLDGSGLRGEGACAAWEGALRESAPRGMELFYMGGVEFIAVVKGGSPHVAPTDPFLHHLPVRELRPSAGWEEDEAAVATAATLRRFVDAASARLERDLPPQEELGLIMKWPSRAAAVEPFRERHGMEAAAVVSTPCFEGMGEALSMRVEKVGEEDAGLDLRAKMAAASRLLGAGFDFVFVHTKHADEAAHTGDPALKREVIARMDRALGESARLFEDPELLAVITADHSTPTTADARVIHGGESVPVLFHGRTVRRDALDRFDEVGAARGGMGQLRGEDLMPLVLYLSRRAPFYTG